MHRPSAPITEQQRFWNKWNAENREKSIGDIERRQAEVVCSWLKRLHSEDLDIIEVGCGSGWFVPQLAQFGRVTATDLSDEVLERARLRVREAKFLAGDFMTLEIAAETFDIAVSLEVLSHVADQPAFIARMAMLLRPGGYLTLATQNRDVLEKYNNIPPPAEGQLRRWVDRRELQDLLKPEFELLELFSVTPRANRGIMRIINSNKLNVIVRAIAGNRVDRLKEAAGLGWTLMALARKKKTMKEQGQEITEMKTWLQKDPKKSNWSAKGRAEDQRSGRLSQPVRRR